eukprot:2454105-Pyramimonas_sp.AAC.1
MLPPGPPPNPPQFGSFLQGACYIYGVECTLAVIGTGGPGWLTERDADGAVLPEQRLQLRQRARGPQHPQRQLLLVPPDLGRVGDKVAQQRARARLRKRLRAHGHDGGEHREHVQGQVVPLRMQPPRHRRVVGLLQIQVHQQALPANPPEQAP